MPFHDYTCKEEAIMHQLQFFSNQCIVTVDLLTPKSSTNRESLCEVCLKFLMMICLKGKQLRNINRFQLSMQCDLDLLTP